MADRKKIDFAQEFYSLMLQAASGRRKTRDQKRVDERKKAGKTKPFEKGRDPISALSSVDKLVADFSWSAELAEGDLHNQWKNVVGEDTASNSQPEDLVDSTLTVRCVSTAWATQLRLMSAEIIERLNTDYPALKIETLKVLGPDAPSWKRDRDRCPVVALETPTDKSTTVRIMGRNLPVNMRVKLPVKLGCFMAREKPSSLA